ncbi:MAG TPA: hypothetical protein VKT82_15935 [Ktedonobacterales bacterium]|nr:hypothetical protein [Ktedonobacterales bacterium]
MPLPESLMTRYRAARRGLTRRALIIAVVVVVLLALAAGGTAYALLGQTATTVIITPQSSVLSQTYTISAVTSLPDASRQQVAARLVSATTPAQTKTVNASGHLALSATQAKGTLILRNWDTVPKTFPAGTDLSDWSADMVINCGDAPSHIILDATVTVPPAVGTAAGYGVAYAPAHVLQPGPGGNIPGATPSDGSCFYFLWAQGKKCIPGYYSHCWTIEPASSFTGGQDAYNGPVVQQSDIDTTVNSLTSAHQPNAQRVLQQRLQPNEQLVGAPQCTPQVSANHQAGDQAAQVQVTVAFTCTGEVYDHTGAMEMAAGFLSQQAAANPGGAYRLAGTIKTTVTNAALGSQKIITLTIAARGVWVYQFTAAQQQQLAALLAGKSAQEAARLAFAQPGVASVTIHLPTGQHALPADSRQITIVLQTPSSA